ncbi:hypothetical protein MTR_0047s0030 [Medicago truncatula]|uniref:Uncharacterized protein n=1 Tax=Medicago truncatula TaxID=3880 RepID=A0A072TJK3_MEDTR|nr:hypothetical protein MTR_0047s0030 [Medicago truncatula]
MTYWKRQLLFKALVSSSFTVTVIEKLDKASPPPYHFSFVQVSSVSHSPQLCTSPPHPTPTCNNVS